MLLRKSLNFSHTVLRDSESTNLLFTVIYSLLVNYSQARLFVETRARFVTVFVQLFEKFYTYEYLYALEIHSFSVNLEQSVFVARKYD